MYLIIKKEKIIKVLSFFLCVLVIGFICFTGREQTNETIATSNENDDKKIVILDAGHGQPDRAEP